MGFQDHKITLAAAILALLIGGSGAALADPVANGNELALAYASASNAAARQAIQKEATGVLQTFRYLKVIAITNDAPQPGAMTLIAVEPSSDMQVLLPIFKRLSLEIAQTLATNECVAVNGRVKSIGQAGTNLIVLESVILRSKDRESPKMSKELMHETDPTAH